ncbi:hypothetical protein E4U42_001212, partial [Claviceps africana]
PDSNTICPRFWTPRPGTPCRRPGTSFRPRGRPIFRSSGTRRWCGSRPSPTTTWACLTRTSAGNRLT